MDIMKDPVFMVRARDGMTGRVSLAEVFARIDRNDLLDLPAMLAHQRPGVVTGLAIVKAVLAHHLERVGIAAPSAADYADLWRREVGPDGGLVVAPSDLSRPGFLQPPLTDEPTVEKGLSGIDLTFADLGHEVKPRAEAGAQSEDWVFALLSGQQKQFVKDNPSGSRWGITVVLPSDGASVGSEIRAVEAAYRSRMDGTTPVRDHFLWLRPWGRESSPIPAALAPYPFLEASRPVRLIQSEGGRIEARQLSLSTPRIEVKSLKGRIGDPHVPTLEDGPYRISRMRRFDIRYVLAVLSERTAAGDTVSVPILNDVDTPWLRICAVGTDQGKTLGYHEVLTRRPPVYYGDEVALARLRDLAGVARADIGAVATRALRPAVSALLGTGTPQPGRQRKDIATAAAAQVIRHFEDAALGPVAAWLADRAPLLPNETADRKPLAVALVPAARLAFDRAVGILAGRRADGPLRIAAATRVFDAGLRHVYDAMAPAPDPMPALVAVVEYAVAKLSQNLHPQNGGGQDAKVLRTMLSTRPPLELWTILQAAGVSPDHLDDPVTTEAWAIIAKGVANLPFAGRKAVNEAQAGPDGGIGAWQLRQLDWSQFRMQRLLDAEGAALRALAEEVWRFVASRRGAYDWRLLAGLVITDAVGDEDAADWCRRRIAMTYAQAKRKPADDGARRHQNGKSTREIRL